MDIISTLKKYTLPIISLPLLFTPFYSLGYVLLLAFATTKLTFSRTYSTIFGRFVLSLLLLAATIMFVGLATWFAGIMIHPIFTAAAFLLIILFVGFTKPNNFSSPKFMDKGDVVSVGLAIIAPLLIVASFYLPKYSDPAVYQLVSNSWDNASHISMLETTSLENGYVYGYYDEVKDKIVSPSNAYPQAWHLATSHLASGFGSNVFNPNSPMTVLNMYVIVLLAWYIIGTYCLGRISWRLLGSLPKNNLKPWVTLLLFTISTLLIQIISFTGALGLGFANYIGLMTYIIIMVAMIIDKESRNQHGHYVMALIMGAAGVLCWFLPFLAIGASLLLSFFAFNHLQKYKFKNLQQLNATSHSILALTLVIALAVITQIAIFVIFSHISSEDQLYAEGGTFPVSDLMLVLVLTYATFYWAKNRGATNHETQAIFITTGPMLLLLFLLFCYQMILAGEATYYSHKIAGLLALIAGIFFIPAFVHSFTYFHSKRIAPYLTAFAGIGIVALLIIGTGQSLKIYNEFVQSSTIVTYETASAVTDYLKNNHSQARLMILTDRSGKPGPKRSENFNGELGNKVKHLPYTCVNYIVNSVNGRTLTQRVNNLEKCAEKLDEDIIVITNNRTKDNVEALGRDDIKIINVK